MTQLSHRGSLLVLRGLPGSGKTTHAFTLVDAGWIRVSKDDLRQMFFRGQYDPKTEKEVVKHIQQLIIINMIMSGHNVVCDNTHMKKADVEYFEQLAEKYSFPVEFKDFFSISVDECVIRDRKRRMDQGRVGATRIRDMWTQYLAEKVTFQ